jgi:ribosomal-protein-alanine N-acetyltransferase
MNYDGLEYWSMSTITLLPATRNDCPDLIRAHIASRSYHQPWVNTFVDRLGFRDWFSHMVSGEAVSLIARDDDSGGVVGICTFNLIRGGVLRSANLGFHGMIDFAGRGFMTEAVRLAAQYAFTLLRLHCLEAHIHPENERSIALVRRVGFRKEGYARDHLIKIDGTSHDHERWALLSGAGIS